MPGDLVSKFAFQPEGDFAFLYFAQIDPDIGDDGFHGIIKRRYGFLDRLAETPFITLVRPFHGRSLWNVGRKHNVYVQFLDSVHVYRMTNHRHPGY